MSSITTSSTTMQSVVLKPGEQFTLPPGARLISATTIDTLDSTCTLPDDLESPRCYLFVIAIGDHDNSDTILWDSKEFRVKGWRYDNKDFNDVVIGATGDAGALPADMNVTLFNSAKAHGLFITDVKFGYNSGDGDNGTHNYIVLKTLPSIAAKLELKVDTGVSSVGGDSFVPAAYLKPLLYSEVTGLVGVPSCTE